MRAGIVVDDVDAARIEKSRQLTRQFVDERDMMHRAVIDDQSAGQCVIPQIIAVGLEIPRGHADLRSFGNSDVD